MNIQKHFLNKDQYYESTFPKEFLFLHHTAGNHNPIGTVDMWNTDSRGKVATTYVIGGKSTTNGDSTMDGLIVQAFPESNWAISLFYNPDMYQLNIEKHTISIEICNYGFVTKKNGQYLNYVNRPIPETDIIELAKPFRGYSFWHNYTDKQIESLYHLISKISEDNNIPLNMGMSDIVKACYSDTRTTANTKKLQIVLNGLGYKGLNNQILATDGLFGKNTEFALNLAGGACVAFEFLNTTTKQYSRSLPKNPNILGPEPGLYSHTNVRKDKVDLYPHPKLIEMFKHF